MKFILYILILFTCLQASAQATIAIPLVGKEYYQTLSLSEHLGKVKRMKNSDNLLRETFKERYAPKKIKGDLDILKRVSRYTTNPNMKSQDLGWLFETYVKNRYKKFSYVKKSNAHLNDLTGRLSDGRFTNAQLKVHKSGNPKTYLKDMQKGYNALFVIPDDHVAPLKNLLKNLARERDNLANLTKVQKLTKAQKSRFETLRSLKIESKLDRIRGGGITYAGLNKIQDDGIIQLINPENTKGLSPAELEGLQGYMNSKPKVSYTATNALKKYNINPKYIAKGTKAIGIVAICYTAYESYSIYDKYSNGNISKIEMCKSYSGLAAETGGAFAGAWCGVKIGGSIGLCFGPEGAIPGGVLGGFIGGIVGAIIGSTTSDVIFDPFITKFDKEQRYRYEEGINEALGYNGNHVLFN